MARDVEPVGASRQQGGGRLPVQQASGGQRHVLVDRVMDELVPEDDPVTGLVEKLGVERLAELGDHLDGGSTGDGGDVAQGHGVTEHGGHLEQLASRRRQVAEATKHEVLQRDRQLGGRRIDEVTVPAQHSLVGQRAQHGHGPERVAAGLGEHLGQRGPGWCIELTTCERADLLGRQRLQPQGPGALRLEVLEQPRHVGREAGGPGRHDDPQWSQGEPSHERGDHRQARTVRPVDVLGHQQDGPGGARRLDEIDDLVDDPELHIARPRRRRAGGPAGKKRADRGAARVTGTPAQTQRRGEDSERPGAFEQMRSPREDDEIVGPCVIDDGLREPRLADPRLALDDQDSCPARAEPAHGGCGHGGLSPSTHQPVRLGHHPTFPHRGPRVQRAMCEAGNRGPPRLRGGRTSRPAWRGRRRAAASTRTCRGPSPEPRSCSRRR